MSEPDHGKPGFYGRLAATVMDRPRFAILILLIISAIAGIFTAEIRLDPDMLNLLPPDEPATRALRDLQHDSGAVNLMTITVEGPDPAKVDSFMLDLQKRLDVLPEVEFTLYKVEPDLVWRLGLINIPLDDLTRLRDRLRGALALGPAIANPFVAAQWLDLGSMTSKLKSREAASPLSTPEGMARILIQPRGQATDMAFAKPFVGKVEAILDELDPDARGVTVDWIGGAIYHNVEDLKGIARDLSQTNGASLVLVLVLVVVAYRRLRAVVLVFVPILIGNLWALGFAGATVRTLTNFSSFFSAVLVGLGIEFSIHLYSRYREEYHHLGDVRAAVIRTWDITGPPSLTSALASAGGFLALWAAKFRGFQQLGTLLAGGNLLCLFAVLSLLPMLILWLEREPPRQVNAAAAARKRRRVRRQPTYRMAPLILLLGALVTVATAFMLPRVPTSFDISEIRREGLAYNDLSEKARKLAQDSYTPVVVVYPDEASLSADHARLSSMVEKGTLPEIARVLSIRSVIPADQDARLSVLREIAELARDPNVAYLPRAVSENLGHIAATPIAPMTRDDLSLGLRNLLGASGEHHWIFLLPAGNMWDLRETSRLYDALHLAIPDRPIASQYLALAMLYRFVQDDAPRVALVALLVVFLTTALDLRNLRWALGAIGALVAGLCWAGAGMVLFQIKLSMVNFVGIPILMGIAVDAIIHLLHRLSEEGPGRVGVALTTTGWAVALGAMTNAFSFASLVFATTRGVQSLGLLVVLGLALVTLAAFLLVPLGWMTAWRITGRHLEVGEADDGD